MSMTQIRPRRESVDTVVAEHALRGAELHVRLRGVLVVFAVATVFQEPPNFYAWPCRWLAIPFLLWAVGIAGWLRRAGEQLVRFTWLVLTVDLLVFGVLNELVGASEDISWTAYILLIGFALLPIAGVSTAAILLTRLQRGRVADIAKLAAQRADLLDQLRSLADRQRRDLGDS